MGGQHETKVQQPGGTVQTPPATPPPTAAPPTPPATPPAVQVVVEDDTPSDGIPKLAPVGQAIRYHLSDKDGEVHFHADDDGIKAAIPVGEWANAWRQLRDLKVTQYQYIDIKNETILRVNQGTDANGNLNTTIQVAKAGTGIGDTYEKLDDFMAKCRGK